MKSKQAFTLIELLVVVLIIGILAAVAVPQYQKAVTKSRYATLKHLVRSIADAEKRYHLANGTYASDFDELDIDMGTAGEDNATRYFPWGYCKIEINNKYQYCINQQIYMSYEEQFSGAHVCLIYKNKPILHAICKQETNGATAYGSGDNYYYFYP